MDDVAALVEWLRKQRNCRCDPGLTDAELDKVEKTFRVTFPPLWRAVLREVHPVDAKPRKQGWSHYPDWRGDPEQLAERIDAPVDGLLFDVEHNDFWWHAWGEAPTTLVPRLAVALEALASVPRLVPVESQRYVASYDGSPVFSIVQADLYVPAPTIADLATGRAQDAVDHADWPIGDVPFWSELHAWSQIGHYDERFAGLGTGGL